MLVIFVAYLAQRACSFWVYVADKVPAAIYKMPCLFKFAGLKSGDGKYGVTVRADTGFKYIRIQAVPAQGGI